MGFKCLRLSICWSRIFPTGMEAEPNGEGLEFYRQVFEALREHGIEPLVTLSHYDYPLALVERYGGWQSREMIERYAHYVETVGRAYQGLVRYWLTFNEINMMSMGSFMAGGLTDGSPHAKAQAAHNQFVASALTVRSAHQISPKIMVGQMLAYNPIYSYSADPADHLLAMERDRKSTRLNSSH